ncbi:hypothetical protein W97_03248 [Coniosporium apollinis CBS 100218]|uniref:F-box domain-containing protein n=1 Tax=Coniosporium apollinis (strain CBS 100218) TaxID=1168221 RepID=R7YQ94_CONA1|nr:uncharacterized protein W97_03248 [Coniosporium apollinis CBS 100218]EON64018.1 hypothetical protein W97_03248 [Coniosporium apollinis CBS 100218]
MLKLPTEIRLRIFEYLLPSKPVSEPRSVDGRTAFGPPGFNLGDWNMSLLLVSRQIFQEASSVLYGKTEFVVEIKDLSFAAPGGAFEPQPFKLLMHPHGRDWKQYLGSLPYKRIEQFHVTILAPVGKGSLPSQIMEYNPKDKERSLYDVRDNVHRLVGLLREAHHIRRLRIEVAIDQRSWTAKSTVAAAKWLLEPLWSLTNIQQLKLYDLLVYHHGILAPIGTKSHTPDLSEEGSPDKAWADYVKEKEALYFCKDPAPVIPADTLKAYGRIDDAVVRLRDVEPCDQEWVMGRVRHTQKLDDLLHRARVAREEGKMNELNRVGIRLRQIWREIVAGQEEARVNIDKMIAWLPSEESVNARITKYFKPVSEVTD